MDWCNQYSSNCKICTGGFQINNMSIQVNAFCCDRVLDFDALEGVDLSSEMKHAM